MQSQSTVASMEEPIFLVGSTRSGTTLLSLMLGHHPEIAFVGEFEWPWDFEVPEAAPLEPYYAWLATHRHFLHHDLRIDKSLGFAELVRDFLRQMRMAADPGGAKLLVGCQVHWNYARALAVWPRARFIHIVRDGRDVCASWLRLGWLGNAYEAGLRWSNLIAEWEALKPGIEADRRIEVRFEELIAAPERHLARLAEFAGVGYSPRMLRYHEDTPYDPVDRSQSSKWRDQLSTREVRLFESVAGTILTRYGYSLSGQPAYRLGPWARRLLSLDNKLKHHRARARIYGTRLWLADIASRWLGPSRWRERVRLAMNEVETSKIR